LDIKHQHDHDTRELTLCDFARRSTGTGRSDAPRASFFKNIKRISAHIVSSSASYGKPIDIKPRNNVINFVEQSY